MFWLKMILASYTHQKFSCIGRVKNPIISGINHHKKELYSEVKKDPFFWNRSLKKKRLKLIPQKAVEKMDEEENWGPTYSIAERN